MITVTVVRSKWDRGRGTDVGDVELYNAEREAAELPSMCCLGFVCEAMGVPRALLAGKGTPAELVNREQRADPRRIAPLLHNSARSAFTRITNADWVTTAISTNDNESIPDSEREERLTTLMAPHGVALRFVDGVPLDTV